MDNSMEKTPGAPGVRSMTGFAQLRRESALGRIAVVVKAVNHRFLDIHLHCPSMLDAWSGEIEKEIRRWLRRGHVDVTLSVDPGESGEPRLNRALIDAYIRAFNALARDLAAPDARPEISEILALPGAFSADGGPAGIPGPENSEWRALLIGTLGQCLEQMDRMRVLEGQAMEQDLRERLARLEAATIEIENLREQLDAHVFARLQRRLQGMLGDSSVPPERLLQEAAMIAERSDVSEEITRLRAHLNQFRSLLDAGVEIGRKLDFLLQELNREVNTMLSKTAGVALEGLRISELGVEMKAEIEKLREQVQNVE